MSEDTKLVPQDSEAFRGSEARRRFLRTSGRVAVAAPAVVLLLAATQKSAVASTYNTQPTGHPY